MYRLMIADDEKFIRKGLTQQIDWKELGFEIVGIFSDGEEVIEYLDSMTVDVILTDIMMTHIGGIDIARYVHENAIPCKVVFISGHKEFDLALSAIKYGVQEYILKPTEDDKIREVFGKIKQELDKNQRDWELQNRMADRLKEMYPILEEKFLGSLIMGALDDRKDIEQRMHLLYPEIDADHCHCFIAELEVLEYDNFIQTKWNYGSGQFDDAIYNFTKYFKSIGSFHVIYKWKGKVRLFAILNEYRDISSENLKLCERFAEEFADEFMKIFHVDVELKIEWVFENIYQVPLCRESIVKKEYRCDEEGQLLQEQKKLLLTNIMTGNISTAQKIMRSILKSLSGDDMRYCLDFVVDMLSSISEMLLENNVQLYRVIQPYIDYRSIINIASMAELEKYCDRIFGKMKSREGAFDQFNKSSLINQVKSYVERHIREDIILEDVANEVYISVTHLSRIFKKQTGESFQQYVIRKKMEKAAELLHDSQYKVYQVGEYLGYKTSWYFSKVFSNYMGYSPGQYRKEVLDMGDAYEEEK